MPRRPSLIASAITALLLITAAVPLAYLTAPYAHRALRLSQLNHPDPATRDRALAYAARHLTHPTHSQATRDAILDTMRHGEASQFNELQRLLDTLGQWQSDNIPLDLWMTWIEQLARSPNPETRIEAAWLATDAAARMHAKRPGYTILGNLLEDQDTAVRLNSVAGLAELKGGEHNGSLQPLETIAAEDPAPAVREEATRLIAAITHAHAAAEEQRDEAAGPLTTHAHQAGAEPLPGGAAPGIRPLPKLTAALTHQDPARQALALTRAHLAPPPGFDPAATADQLLRSFDPIDRRAGALLAATHPTDPAHTELIRTHLDHADTYPQAAILELALALLGEPDARDPTLLLATPDALPMPLVYWAMIHPAFANSADAPPRQQNAAAIAALDHLLNPRGDAPPGLVDFLVHQHGWAALAAFTSQVGPQPSPDHPAAAELAVERLRDHWLVTRRAHHPNQNR
ncbi:MAG: HEAT repeat domain-containing protein [Planctomycetota bacterium]